MVCASSAFGQINPIQVIKNTQKGLKIISRTNSTYGKFQRYQARKNSSYTTDTSPQTKVAGFDYARPAVGAEAAMRLIERANESSSVEFNPIPFNFELIILRAQVDRLELAPKGVKIIEKI
jgi:hypothetical protein